MKTTWPWLWLLLLLTLPGCTTPEHGAERGAAWGDDPALSSDGGTICQGVVCDPNATCAGTGTDARCVCLDGYTGDGTTCSNIDECADPALNDCDALATCIDTPGSFRCECAGGSVGDGKQCSDVDECAGTANTCDPNATCVNTQSGFACECNTGFTGDGFGCADIDECADPALYACADNAVCENTFGSYDCRCAPGFSGDGKTACVSLCEIAKADPSVCDAQGLCRVVGLEAVCDACEPGTTGDGVTCAAATCDAGCDGLGGDELPHAVCTADGSCACAPGYTGVVTACADIDECSASGVCGANALCVNQDGGYACGCQSGFVMDSSGTCVDEDECAQSPCHPDATCTNVSVTVDPAGYQCTCKPGFTGDGTVCTDIDECATNNGGCATNATCVNERGSSSCECQSPLIGDPDSCHCDLTGLWAMRQDVDTCWGARQLIAGNAQNLFSAGYMEATVWELRELVYDGNQIDLRARGCGADNSPDLVSPLFRETYSAYIPFASYDIFDMIAAPPFNQPGIVPGFQFTTPSVAAVIGIDLGPDPLNAPWPASHSVIPDSQWVDADKDGEPGLTLWSRLPSEVTDAGTRNYSYLPAKPAINGDVLTIDQRAGCLSVAIRVISHLEVTVEDCTRMTGRVVNDKTEGRVRSCAYVDKGTCDPVNPNDCTGWHQDIACTPEYWSSAARCDTTDLDRLDDDQNQAQDSKATFELIRIGDVGQNLACSDVRTALPAIVRSVPTITCTTPQ